MHRASSALHDALASYRAARAMHQRLHAGRDHHDVARTHRKVSAVLAMLGAGEEARAHAEEAAAIVRRMGLHPHAFRRLALKCEAHLAALPQVESKVAPVQEGTS